METLLSLDEYGYVHHEDIVLFQKGPLSQWYGGFEGQSGGFCPSLQSDIRCNCGEQWMMLAKAAIFNDEETFDLILQTESPKEQKELGRRIKNFNSVVWDTHKFDVVEYGNIWKFEQNEHLKEFIMQFPKDTIFAEAAPWDKVWGIGLNPTDPDALDPSKWLGENLLGKVLTNVRNQL